MCGIFGGVSSNVNNINEANIKILGLYNQVRGKDSCGITIDGEIYHGIEKTKLIENFIKYRDFSPEKIPIVFGHTRSASVGIVDIHNAHPFGFGNNEKEDCYETIFVHNGTLLNHKELADNYEIDKDREISSDYNPNVKIVRSKIDSEILGEILYKTKNFNVLSEYNGRAALVWYHTSAPDTIYLFSGKSKPSSWYANNTTHMEEERPLHVWVKNENTFYFSSLPGGLEVIGAQENEAFQIDYNTVYIVKNGNFNQAEKILIDRSKNYINEYTTNYNQAEKILIDRSKNYINEYTTNYNQHFFTKTPYNKTPKKSIVKKDKVDAVLIKSIFEDTPLKNQNDYKGKVYNFSLRYFRNGTTINGIYAYIPYEDTGFYKLGSSIKEALETISFIKNKKFYNGCFKNANFHKGEVIFKQDPFLYYFIDGIMLKTETDYVACFTFPNKFMLSKKVWDYEKLSYASIHPVCDIRFRSRKNKKSFKSQNILLNGELYTGTVDLLGFEKIYEIVDGNLEKTIEKTININKKKEFDNQRYNNAIYQIDRMEADIIFNEKLKLLPQATNEDIVGKIDSIVDDYLSDSIIELETCKDQIRVFLPDPYAESVISQLDDAIFYFNNNVIKI